MKSTRTAILVALLVLVVSTCKAAGPSLSVSLQKTSFLIGEPIPLTYVLMNSGPSPLNVWVRQQGNSRSEVVGIRLEVTSSIESEGSNVPCALPNLEGLIVKGPVVGDVPHSTLFPGEHLSDVNQDLFLNCPFADVRPGAYEVRAKLSVAEPEMSKTIWQGEISSDKIRFALISPQGDDKAYVDDLIAYLASGKKKRAPLSTNPLTASEITSICAAPVIEAHSTSIYTAWSVYLRYLGGAAYTNVTKTLRSMETGIYGENNLPDIAGSQGTVSASSEQCIKWRSIWINRVLSSHPDFFFADDIRLRRALDNTAMKRYSEAYAELHSLASSPDQAVAKKAQEYIAVFNEKKWGR